MNRVTLWNWVIVGCGVGMILSGLLLVFGAGGDDGDGFRVPVGVVELAMGVATVSFGLWLRRRIRRRARPASPHASRRA